MSDAPPPPLHGSPVDALRAPCGACGRTHEQRLDVAQGLAALASLFADVDGAGAREADRALLAASRGKMLGVLVGEDAAGGRVTLRAYSGDLGGTPDRAGWAPNVWRREATAALEAETLSALTVLTAELHDAPPERRPALLQARRLRSSTLMAAMLDGTRLTNAAGRRAPLREVFLGGGIPSGTATCVVPKLLVAANLARLRPVALAEAWWGPPYGERRHGLLGAPCAPRCLPLLGYLLCREAA